MDEPLLLQVAHGANDLDTDTGDLLRGERTGARQDHVEGWPGHELEGEVGWIFAVGPAHAGERGAVVAEQVRDRGLAPEGLLGDGGGLRSAVVSPP